MKALLSTLLRSSDRVTVNGSEMLRHYIADPGIIGIDYGEDGTWQYPDYVFIPDVELDVGESGMAGYDNARYKDNEFNDPDGENDETGHVLLRFYMYRPINEGDLR